MSSNSHGKWDGLTASGTLPIGVHYAGQRHKEFVLRVSLVGDLIGAQTEYPNVPVRKIALELFRRQLLKLGEIPAEALTLSLLEAEMTDIDIEVLEEEDTKLTKKLKPASGPSQIGEPSKTPSSGTAIASTK